MTTSTNAASFMSRFHNDDLGKLVLRLSVGGLFLFHGIHKVQHGVGGMVGMITAKGLPGFIAHGAYVGEVVAPILIILGLFTRPAGLLVSFTMVMAIFLAHMDDLAKIGPHGGYALELQMLFLLGGVAIFFLGAGKYRVTKAFSAWS